MSLAHLWALVDRAIVQLKQSLRTINAIGGCLVDEVERVVLWQSLYTPGAERCRLRRLPDGWGLAGTVVLALDDAPAQVTWRVECDDDWRTRRVAIELEVGNEARALELRVGEHRRWWRGDEELEQLRGCVDIDISVTPATNTLPIRRLALATGESAALVAAWVRFPELAVEPLTQRYTRLDTHRYRYEGASGVGYDVEVDDWDMATRYADLWIRVAAH